MTFTNAMYVPTKEEIPCHTSLPSKQKNEKDEPDTLTQRRRQAMCGIACHRNMSFGPTRAPNYAVAMLDRASLRKEFDLGPQAREGF